MSSFTPTTATASSSNKRISPLDLFKNNSSNDNKKYLNVCAPMVRYNLTYTPMILAKEFQNSAIARDFDFTTNFNDTPLIMQFASNNNKELVNAVELVYGYVDGIDINCGCPQKWAINEGIGVYLMEKPEIVRNLVKSIKNFCNIPCSIKIRIHNDLRKTLDFVKSAESIGLDFITVHGRTRKQKSSDPVNLEAIKLIKQDLQIPVIANGGIFTLKDAEEFYQSTKVDGVMSARGLLRNPTLFANNGDGKGYSSWEYVMSNAERKTFNTLTSIPAILNHLETHYGLN
ncbi:3237_t:CDS:2 [Entrophospora sp. SA101]|nr:10277_t:CDS:2 [Entrophospora sp. SA101]CAJ0905034.1 3237_t:CDS:2 [Entrophospora sp. SA101]